MPRFHVGCAGWAYDDWKGSFYPKKIDSSQFLSYYSKIFDTVEVNTTFYHIPMTSTLEQWNFQTPKNFEFTIKIWQKISHRFDFTTIDRDIASFFSPFDVLEEKVHAYLLQFPPNFKNSSSHLQKLKYLMANFPQKNFVVEFRNKSWISEEIDEIFNNFPNWNYVTTYISDFPAIYPQNQAQIYIRMIGDHQLTKFNHTQREKEKEFMELVDHSFKLQEIPSITDIFVIFNNHFRGFSPTDVNEFKKQLHLPFTKFNFQSKLTDFI